MPQIHPGFRRNFYYSGIGYVDAMSTQVMTANRLYFMLTYIPVPVIFNYVGIAVSTAGAANTNARIGLYSNNQSSGYPDSLVQDFGVVPTSSIGNKEITIDYNFIPDWYYLTVLFSGTPTVRAKGNGEFNDYWGGSFTPTSNATFLYTNQTYNNGFPELVSGFTVIQGKIPYVWLRRI